MSGSTLKIIAVFTMIIDHIGAVFFPYVFWLRVIGRIAFPIFCYLLVEGFLHTKNLKKYLYTLFAFAFVSEIPFDLAFHGFFPYMEGQNVFFTLAIGLIMLYLFDKFMKEGNRLLALGAFILACVISEMTSCDYGYMGIGFILCFYLYKTIEGKQKYLYLLVFALLTIVNEVYFVQSFALLALVPIYFYNGRRGLKLKYIFYAIYPIHLALFALLNYG